MEKSKIVCVSNLSCSATTHFPASYEDGGKIPTTDPHSSPVPEKLVLKSWWGDASAWSAPRTAHRPREVAASTTLWTPASLKPKGKAWKKTPFSTVRSSRARLSNCPSIPILWGCKLTFTNSVLVSSESREQKWLQEVSSPNSYQDVPHPSVLAAYAQDIPGAGAA